MYRKWVVIFQKKSKEILEKRENIWKFGQKCTKFENILKKGRWLCAVIACNKLPEQALTPLGLLGLVIIRWTFLIPLILQWPSSARFSLTACRFSFNQIKWQPSIFPSPSLSLFLRLWQVQSGMSSIGMTGYSWPLPAKSSSIHATFHYNTLSNTYQKILLTYDVSMSRFSLSVRFLKQNWQHKNYHQ